MYSDLKSKRKMLQKQSWTFLHHITPYKRKYSRNKAKSHTVFMIYDFIKFETFFVSSFPTTDCQLRR